MRYLLVCSVAWLGLGSGLLVSAAPAPASTPRASALTHPALVTKPVQGFGTGLTGFYFTNGTLAGAPALQRLDAAIDFRWGVAAPAPGVPTDNFSVRWEGLLAAPTTGRYRFVVQTTDEVRLWVDGKKVLDTWDGKKANLLDPTVSLAAGEKTAIRLEYADGGGEAGLQLQWAPPGQAAQLIPMGNLYPLGSPTTPDPAGPRPAPVAKAAVAPKAATVAKTAAAPKAAAAAPKATPGKPAPAKAAPAPAATAKAKAAPSPEAVAAAKAKADEKAAKAAAKAKAAAAAATPPTPLVPGVYVLTARTTGAALEIPDEGRYASRILQPDAKAKSTQWKIETAGDGFYRLLVQGSNKVLEVLGSSTSNGAPLSLWSFYSGNNQIWRIEEVGDGYYKVIAKHSRKALSAKDSIEGGVQQWRYSGKENQQWKLTPVAPAEAPPVAAALSLPGVGANHMSVYPNPSNGVVQMSYQLSEEKPLGWVLYNERGVAVRVSDYRKQASGPHHQSLDFTDLPAGDYNLNLTVGTVTTKQPLILRRPSAEATAPQGASR
ncbi:RICIN domain-containing protein [Hymenobacter sp. HSC-4F20]|uniref:PA14 domain-containing protein n=1 Tax=Hymenobacter sp. HSC-4F20 TaxID=2864135 RepID=UPI001C7382F1|nr:PA14 domain-containing protein [Hymenobacter sp. HSC-4F20]MBX0291610.1 RICIN domain-containing protein [Hymenobacter sp. HSC-4F20]